MKSHRDDKQKEKVKAAELRPVGPEAEKLPHDKKKLLNLNEESQHQSGKDRLVTDEAVREVDGHSK